MPILPNHPPEQALPSHLSASDWRLPVVQPSVPGLYIHIPFCFHKCHYCDFYSITRQTPERMNRFVDLILSEARGWADGARGPVIQPQTIFFGGGTPSLLPLSAMQRLLCSLRTIFDLSGVHEWTVECNPATVTSEYAHLLREEGVSRLSFGAQSFNLKELALLERHHNPDDVPRSIEIARSAGFHRLNLDLIYAIPGQDLAAWSCSLESALALQTEHLSCYALTYEPNTPIAVRKRLGNLIATEDELELEMLHFTRQRMSEAGYHAYEISNYARRSTGCTSGAPTVPSGAECRHNLLYWNGGSYLGLGPSAASHVHGYRWRNRPHLGEWETAVEQGGIPTTDVEHLTPRRRAGELAMLQLRLADGIRFTDFFTRTGIDARRLFSDPLHRLAQIGVIDIDDLGFRLTERGLNVADAIAAEFLE